MTDNGAEPLVLGVQVGERGKPGLPLVPHGVTLAIAHAQRPDVQRRFGLTGLLGVVFVRSDGTIASSYDRAPTSKEITSSLTAIQWLGSAAACGTLLATPSAAFARVRSRLREPVAKTTESTTLLERSPPYIRIGRPATTRLFR